MFTNGCLIKGTYPTVTNSITTFGVSRISHALFEICLLWKIYRAIELYIVSENTENSEGHLWMVP